MKKNLILGGVFIICLMLLLNSCRKDDFLDEKNSSKSDLNSDHEGPIEPADIIIALDNITCKTIILQSIEGDSDYFLLFDDILIPKRTVSIIKLFQKPFNYNEIITEYEKCLKSENVSSFAAKISAPIEASTRLWPTGEVAFSISEDFSTSKKSEIYQAISNWAKLTRLKFRIVSDAGNVERIKIAPVHAGCNSTMGRPGEGGTGQMNLSETCDVQSITHEIGHAVGLIHEHQRPLRDKYLTSVYNDKDYEYIIGGLNEMDLNGYAIAASIRFNLSVTPVIDDSAPFDYKSVMMYGSYPRNNKTVLEFLQLNKKPFYKDLEGKEIPRPIFGLTAIDRQKVIGAYSDEIDSEGRIRVR